MILTIQTIIDKTPKKKFKRKEIEKAHKEKKEPKNPMLPPVDLNSRFR
jgi:hypothetical protein